MSSLEEQLFKIFTHYAIHTDCSQPESWKNGTIIRFAKDCQFLARDNIELHSSVSPPLKLTSAEIELEITKLLKNHRRLEINYHFQYSGSITFGFDEFLLFLGRISKKVYPGFDAQISMRRLLLENIFPLANRRLALNSVYSIHSNEALDALKPLEKGLRSIFDYYLSLADTRRNTSLAGKIAKLTNSSEAQMSNSVQQAVKQLKNTAKSYKDLIGFPEYLQFCNDYQLRSSAYITAVQLADIFLQVVPYDTSVKGSRGMGYEGFIDAVLYMANIAFRIENRHQYNSEVVDDNILDGAYEIPPQDKVKAFLLCMWKSVNHMGDPTASIFTVVDKMQDFHPYGSKLFSQTWLPLWQKEQFRDYTSPPPQVYKSGQEVLQNILNGSLEPLTKSSRSRGDSTTWIPSSPSSSSLLHQTTSATINELQHMPEVIAINGALLAQLFQKKPELKELVALELENFQQELEKDPSILRMERSLI